MEFQNYQEMFLESLKLYKGWKVIKTKFDSFKREVHVYIENENNEEGICPICGEEKPKYDFEDQIKMWRHGDCVFFPTYIHCRRMRTKCDKCGIHTVNVPWARETSKFTLQFEGYALFMATNMPLSQACVLLRCGYKQLFNIIKYWVNKAIEERVLDDVTAINVDETSSRKGHNYVTVIIDAVRRYVIDVEIGKDNTTMIKFREFLIKHGGDPNKINTFISDLSNAFKKGCEENFPNAKRVNDKFHVKQMLTKAINEIRKAELRKEVEESNKKLLKQTSKTLMKKAENLTEKQSKYVDEVNKKYKNIGKAYEMIETLDDIYSYHLRATAEVKFNKLIGWMMRCKVEELKKVGRTYKENKEQILNYFDNNYTNAVAEGINNNIQSIKRRAKGYSNIENFIMMIYLIAGKLNINCPFPY